MKCLFCSNDTLKEETAQFRCNGCNAHFYYESNDVNKEIVIWQFFFKYKNKTFGCIWDQEKNNITIFKLGKIFGEEKIATFCGSSNLTPSNIHKKMSTILTFS